MFNHRFDQNVENKVVLHWFLMSLNGGAINAGGFLATGKFVSHVTGFATLFGVDMADFKIKEAIGILSVPLFFLLGAFIAGMLVDRQIHLGKKPHFDWVMGLSALCLATTAAAGVANPITFGGDIALQDSYLLLSLLCLACGLQNAAITSSSGRSVRTTHLTGLTTDLGLGLAKILTLDIGDKKLQSEWRANYLRMGSILSFVVGSAIGAFVFVHYGYSGFILPTVISAYIAWHGKKAKLHFGRAQ